MILSVYEQALLDGLHGRSAMKSMQILYGLGKIYNASKMIPVSSVQIAGVSYDNLGEAGLTFLTEMADGGGRVKPITTLNPAGMDTENWRTLGIDVDFAQKQQRVLDAFERMGVTITCTCTPYLSGNLPHYGEHIAWAESSAVCYANSVIGARTNREGGPGALAAALTGVTPAYGLHITENRPPVLLVEVLTPISGTHAFGALGQVIGEKMEMQHLGRIPLITGIPSATLEELKSFCASIATYGGVALFHMQDITPEAALFPVPEQKINITGADLVQSMRLLGDDETIEIDFVTLGCPHLSLLEMRRVAELLAGRHVTKEFWITTSRPIKQIADRMGYTQIIQASGAKVAVDTCCVVAPIRNRFFAMATDSAKACYYAYAKNNFKTLFLTFEQVIEKALQ
jgi:predicted aconitase